MKYIQSKLVFFHARKPSIFQTDGLWLYPCLFEVLSQFQHFFYHILVVIPPNPLSWITNKWSPISAQVTNYWSHMISELMVRDKWLLDTMSEINCYREITPRLRIEPATPALQIRCPTHWANQVDMCLLVCQ